MKSSKVADLTIDEFSELMQKVVIQTFSTIMDDPDVGLELRDNFAEEFNQFLVDIAGGNVPTQKMAEWLRILQLQTNNTTQLSDDKFEALADKLADEFMEYAGPDCPPLPDYAVTREGLYEDHL